MSGSQPITSQPSPSQIGPPPQAPTSLPRPRLESRLAAAASVRLTTVVAGNGFGKSTLLGAFAATTPCSWYTLVAEDARLDRFAAGLAGALGVELPALPAAGDDAADRVTTVAAELALALAARGGPLVLVLDDLQEIASAPSVWLVEGLLRHASAGFHLVVATRRELPFRYERLRGSGQVVEISATELAFTVEETAALLGSIVAPDAADLASAVHGATGGWPVAVRLAAEAVRALPASARADATSAIAALDGSLFDYLAGEVFAGEDSDTVALIRRLSLLDRFTPALADAVGVSGERLAGLARRGLFVEPIRDEPGWFSLIALVREFCRTRLPVGDDEAHATWAAAARWLEADNRVPEALRAFAEAGENLEIERALIDHGETLLRRGNVATIVEAADHLDSASRHRNVDMLAGQAKQVAGDYDGALACYERAATGAEDLPASLAWRMGLIHHVSGSLDDAMQVYARGRLDGSEPADESRLISWIGTAHWLRGDMDLCAEHADRALALAETCGDLQALASAHTLQAIRHAAMGDMAAADVHDAAALDCTERSGDVLQQIRVLTNRGAHRAFAGRFADALDDLDRAVRMTELTGSPMARALALTNRGDVRMKLGAFEEAIVDLEAATKLYERVGSRMQSYGLTGLGDVYRERGDRALARAAYEEAIKRAGGQRNMQALVPATAGLARVLAPDEPEEAASLIERARSLEPGLAATATILAGGWVRLAAGDVVAAADAGRRAAEEARARRERAGLAESLELQGVALVEQDRDRAEAMLREAISVWEAIGARVGAARASLALARVLLDPDEQASTRAAAEAQLRALGARAPDLPAYRGRPGAGITVLTLGGFRVVRDDGPVPRTAWQSRKARDLLKILIARRGRAVPREQLAEMLWPDEDPAKVSNRLAVALSTLRSVLDPDGRFDADRFVAADKASVQLSLAHVRVDVEQFLDDAERGHALVREGKEAEGERHLAAAERTGRGDFLEEDAYEEWAVPLREEARTVYLSVTRALAGLAGRRGDHESAARHLLRSLERDPFDEWAHLRLVEAVAAQGRHGEARRFYQAYCSRMAEIDVEAAPYPGSGPRAAAAP